MSVVDHQSPAPSLRRLPFAIRLSPQVLNQLTAQRHKPFETPGSITGLLFGVAEEGTVIVQAHREFAAGAAVNGSEAGPRQNTIFEQQLAAAQKAPETAGLNLIGWYAVRESGGLFGSDLVYHERYFPRPNDLALILKPEGKTEVLLELYCRTVAGQMSEEGHRLGLVRLTAAPLESPVEVALRPKIQDDFFMRAYQLGDADEEKSGLTGWKGMLAVRSRQVLGLFRPNRDTEDPVIDPVLKGNKPQEEPAAVPVSSKPPSPPEKQRETVDAAAKKISAASVPGTGERAEKSPEPASTEAAKALIGAARNAPGALSLVPAPKPLVPVALPPARPKPWPWALAAFAITALLTFVAVYYLRTTQWAENLPAFLQPLAPAPGLGMKLEAQGDRLLLSWNRQNALVRHARDGTLQIDDGSQKRQIALDAAQVANGSISYRPSSDDVTFRLEVHSLDGHQAAESMRVLDGAKPTALDLSPDAPKSKDRVTEAAGGRPVTSPPPAAKKTADLQIAGGARAPETAPKDANPPAVSTDGAAAQPVKANDEEVQAVPEDKPAPQLPVGTPTAQAPAPSEPAPGKPVEKPAVAPAREAQLEQAPTNIPASQPPPGYSYQPPKPIRQVLPNVSGVMPGILAAAGQVEILVKVDENGRVIDARPTQLSRKVSVALLGSVLSAARQWRFQPAIMNGKPVRSEHSILFQFARTQ